MLTIVVTFIFYDFETSSRHLLGQILSYAFVLTDASFTPLQTFSGSIRLSRTQCPEVDAILTNKLDVSQLQETGQSEHEAALAIHGFLSDCISRYYTCTLVGFNSNRFDLSFLRVLFIRFGLNPYFMGRLKNKDILHWAQHLAFCYPDDFPWVLTTKEDRSYYSFRLEDLCQASQLLTEAQTHDALDDVLLTIELVRHFEGVFDSSFASFTPVYFPESMGPDTRFMTQKCRHYVNDGESPEKYMTKSFYYLCHEKKSVLLIDCDRLSLLDLNDAKPKDLVSCVRYINPNKHFFVGSPDTGAECQPDLALFINDNAFFNALKQQPTLYFEYTKKDWDIEYRIHDLGFERIDTLANFVQKFFQDQALFPGLLQQLLGARKEEKDGYLIQLFNRVYLNYHDQPDPALLKRYLIPRYVSGTMYNEDGCDGFFNTQKIYLETCLNNPELDADIPVLQSLKRYYDEFELLLI